MFKLDPARFSVAEPLLKRLAETHASIDAVTAGVLEGDIWVDDPRHPKVALLCEGGDGYYLAGDVDYRPSYAALKRTIPHTAYLIPDRVEWGEVLEEIWDNRFARLHHRKAFCHTGAPETASAQEMADGFELALVDRNLLDRSDLVDHERIADHLESWSSPDVFLQHAIGYCLIHNNTIVSHCLADSVVQDRCELGVGTEEAYRGLGIGSLVTRETVARCLERGIRRIGWHCHASNAGSMRVADAAGLVEATNYVAFSSTFPAENVGDLPAQECLDWAHHYEAASADISWYAFHAAGSFALAGDHERALVNLRRLVDSEWEGNAEWLETYWTFTALRDHPDLPEIVAAQARKLGNR
ncbi:GNAT family N-acetyltransferase [Aminobacter sp. AP02]|uniref:GNAT family N-acetyltransferase n=1 Tax=Aminobacter sp. AP02 TaxID=2135737 RepID=UPI000D7AC342|nr:GNAT family N-acetyltransferase [Aminobacter sp. AP02]PWK70631.1 GNAT acetyltransferase-like protein [Aminobacter sp. AP02]